MASVFLGFGSNLGDRESNIRAALDRLAEHPRIRVEQVSSLYESAPVGVTDQPDFVNAVAEIETDLDPLELLCAILQLEDEMGRVRNFHWCPRVIDIDILMYDHAVINTPELTVPHPRMMERAFVMVPLAEIAPDIELPCGLHPPDVLRGLKDQRVCKLAEVA